MRHQVTPHAVAEIPIAALAIRSGGSSSIEPEGIPDIGLNSAATDLDRIDAEIKTLSAKHPGKDLLEIRGMRTREAQRSKALRTLCRTEALTTAGLEAKARALRTPELIADVVRHSALAASLAEDMARLNPAGESATAMADQPSLKERPVGSSDAAGEQDRPYDDEWEAKAVRAAAATALADYDLSTPVTDSLRVAITNHRDARLTFLAETDLSDEVTDRGIHRIDEAEAALHAVPSRTPADLRAKVAYWICLMLADPDKTNDQIVLQNLIDEADRLARRPIHRDKQAFLATEARDPIFAAITTSRRANEAFARGQQHLSTGLVDGETEMQRLRDARDKAWAALLAVRPTTSAGGGALAAHVADWISANPDLGRDEIVTLLRAIGAVGIGHARSETADPERIMPPGFMRTTECQGAWIQIAWGIAAEARRLHEIASDEFDRRMTVLRKHGNLDPATLERRASELRRELRLDPLFEAAGNVVAEVPAPAPDQAADPAVSDPAFAAMTVHREAHIALQTALKAGDLATSDAAMERKDAAFEALLRTVPTTEAGRAAATRHVLFEFARIASDGGATMPKNWAREAGRLVNRGFPVLEDTLPTQVIEPVAAEVALQVTIEAHQLAYGHRLYSMVAGEADVVERAEQERQAFRALLHTPLGSDRARVAYAKAVLGRACGAYGDECDGIERSASLPTAYRNLAFGDHAPEPTGATLLAAE